MSCGERQKSSADFVHSKEDGRVTAVEDKKMNGGK